MINNVFLLLQTLTTFGAGYVGYHYSPQIKTLLNGPYIKSYKNMLGFERVKIMTEDNFCRLTGTLSGMVIGYHCWPIALPVVLLFTEQTWKNNHK